MAIKFATDEWIKALCAQLNANEAYAQAAKDWEGDFYFIVEPEGSLTETIYLYMDLWHGKCREAFATKNPDERNPAYRMSAPMSTWRKVIEKQLDPIQGMMTRKLKLKGDMMRVMKVPKAAIEIVNSCTKIETEFLE
ncbi:MAG: SCP2 sterol-binding domain-containing protein [Anaerolineae bacterium]|jgi:putative sterol carrier protein|nr:SCP2 sterol-binding domain-containing protein [Anaerolineae bacterium]MDH7472492.1 SCP2 sterol-binding domain-containing protein [Anaerolineae bacterium]